MKKTIGLPSLQENLDIDSPVLRRWQALFYLYTGLTPWAADLEQPKGGAQMPLCGDEWIMCCGCTVDKAWGEALLETGAAIEIKDRLERRALRAGDRNTLFTLIADAWTAVQTVVEEHPSEAPRYIVTSYDFTRHTTVLEAIKERDRLRHEVPERGEKMRVLTVIDEPNAEAHRRDLYRMHRASAELLSKDAAQ